jgi:adenine-specific DNA-methyltransferase
MPHRQDPKLTAKARALREAQTQAESLLWNVLRARRLCGLKFRRQFPIAPFIVDFACVARKLVVEIDGGYHDYA